MAHRVVVTAWCGVLTFGLVGCSTTSSKTGAGPSTTIPKTATSVRVALSSAPTVSVAAVSSAVTVAADQAPVSTSAVAALTAGDATATTAAGRVVSKPNDNVALGDTGPGVKQVQSALVAHGYKVTVDGSFGPKTEQAVKGFQTKNGLKQDGVVGPETWTKLKAAATTTKPTATTIKATTTTKH